MSIQTRNPVRFLGGVQQSGAKATGESPWTQGGQETYTSFSGLGVATLIYSGAAGMVGGRLNYVQITNAIQSGFAVHICDAAVATSGGPFSTSGHKILWTIPGMNPAGAGASGIGYVVNPQAFQGAYAFPSMPFTNGLVAFPVASGGPSFTLSFTPEFVPQSGPQQMV